MTTFINKLQQYNLASGINDTHVVLHGEDSQITLAQMLEKVSTLGKFLQEQNIKTLALLAGNSPEWVIADLACQDAGICFLPLPAFFSNSQLQHCLREAGADALFSDNTQRSGQLVPEHIYTAKEPVTGFTLHRLAVSKAAHKPLHTSKITFTSGSTGSPKGVCLDNDIQNQVAASLNYAIQLQQQKHLCLLPLSTLLENVAGVYNTLLSGGSVYLLPEQTLGFSGTGLHINKLLASIELYQPNTLILLPELLMALTQACSLGWQAPASLQFIAVGGAKVASALINKARSHGLPVYEGYGLSECGSVVSLNTRADDGTGSSGKPLAHNSVNIENGEIVVHGKVFLGYLNDPASWYPDSVATGDLASSDDDSFLHIHGRRKNLLISSFGRNINPEWIESEILANAAIQQCVVVGDAQPFCSALIVSRSAATSASEIQAWLDQCNQQLPEYAQVKAWIHLPEAMTSATGLWTENGRPKRAAITAHFSQALDRLYAPSGANAASLSASVTFSASA